MGYISIIQRDLWGWRDGLLVKSRRPRFSLWHLSVPRRGRESETNCLHTREAKNLVGAQTARLEAPAVPIWC